jgi:hypothetical protein
LNRQRLKEEARRRAAEAEADQQRRLRQVRESVRRRIAPVRQAIQAAASAARKQLLEQLAALPLGRRLEHIAWDDQHPLSYYPANLVEGPLEQICEADPVSLRRLIEKASQRRRGGWRAWLRNLRKAFPMLWNKHASGKESSANNMNPQLSNNGLAGHLGLLESFRRAPSTQSAAALIRHFITIKDPEPVADLASLLADSGVRLDFGDHAADVASTGGPSSLSTLLCPVFLAMNGYSVPKLGVQGRPAGGIDVMAQIPGFDINPSPAKVADIITGCRFAHFLANETYAPLDQWLFRYRQEFGVQSVRNLVVASILAKKLAVGVTTAGLEIRVFPGGNFGSDVSIAIENAQFFLKVAEHLNIRTTVRTLSQATPV